MAQNVPVSDLRDYKKVLDRVEEEAPVNLTVKGRGRRQGDGSVSFLEKTQNRPPVWSPCLYRTSLEINWFFWQNISTRRPLP